VPHRLGARTIACASRAAAIGAMLDGHARDARASEGHAPPRRSIRLIRQFYDPILSASYDEPRPRLADLDQLETIAAGYPIARASSPRSRWSRRRTRRTSR
jgi:hypothetical protein